MLKIKKKVKNIYIGTFVIIIFLTIIFFSIISKRALPTIINYASTQTKRVGISVLKDTGISEVNKFLKGKDIFKLSTNKSGEIESIDFDTALLNETLIIVSKSIRNRLKEVENGENLPEELYSNITNSKIKKGMIYEVPLGVAFNNIFFANLGPKIPIKITYTGNVGLDLKTRVSEYGVNSALIEVFILAEVTQKTISPFSSKDVKLKSEIPIIIKVIKGSVPNYLLGTNDYLITN